MAQDKRIGLTEADPPPELSATLQRILASMRDREGKPADSTLFLILINDPDNVGHAELARYVEDKLRSESRSTFFDLPSILRRIFPSPSDETVNELLTKASPALGDFMRRMKTVFEYTQRLIDGNTGSDYHRRYYYRLRTNFDDLAMENLAEFLLWLNNLRKDRNNQPLQLPQDVPSTQGNMAFFQLVENIGLIRINWEGALVQGTATPVSISFRILMDSIWNETIDTRQAEDVQTGRRNPRSSRPKRKAKV